MFQKARHFQQRTFKNKRSNFLSKRGLVKLRPCWIASSISSATSRSFLSLKSAGPKASGRVPTCRKKSAKPFNTIKKKLLSWSPCCYYFCCCCCCCWKGCFYHTTWLRKLLLLLLLLLMLLLKRELFLYHTVWIIKGEAAFCSLQFFLFEVEILIQKIAVRSDFLCLYVSFGRK